MSLLLHLVDTSHLNLQKCENIIKQNILYISIWLEYTYCSPSVTTKHNEMSVPIDLVWITVCHYGFTAHTDISTLSPLFHQQQTPHLHEACIKWPEKSRWCHFWQQHVSLRVLSLSLLSVSAAVLVPYQRFPQSDLWVLLWSFESDQMCSDLAENSSQDVHDISVCSSLQLLWQSHYYRIHSYSECISIIPLSSYSVPNK